MRTVCFLLLALQAIAFCCSFGASAHELRPAFLHLRETGPETFKLLWKKPVGGEQRLEIVPAIPENCMFSNRTRERLSPGTAIARGTLKCNGGIAGKTLRVLGLESAATDVLVRIERGGSSENYLLKPTNPMVTLGAALDGPQQTYTYLRLGVEHILLGADHLLFVLALLLIVLDRWMLIKTITSFTVAHSITLAVATLGLSSIPAAPLNAAIALSILFLGPEIVRRWRGDTSFTIRHPWVAAFAFGLLHGFGFASGLTTLGLPETEIPLALLLFNFGVEIGQIAFVLLVLLLSRAFRVLEIVWPRAIELLPAYLVGSLGAFWTIDRILVLI